MFPSKQAENAAEYLGKGSHVNIVGRLRNNNYLDAEGADVYALAFTCEEIDYLDSKAMTEARDARRARMDAAPAAPAAPTQPTPAPAKASNPGRRARPDRQPAHADA